MFENTYCYRVYTALDLFNRWHNATQSDSSANNAKLFFFSIIVNLSPRHFTDYWYFLSWKNTTSFPMRVVRMYKAIRRVTYCGVKYDHWCFSRLHKYNGNIFGSVKKIISNFLRSLGQLLVNANPQDRLWSILFSRK